jgi:hypothetical protein
MKALIQLLVVVLLVNAGVQAARSYYNFHQFQRDVHEQTMHGVEVTTADLAGDSRTTPMLRAHRAPQPHRSRPIA